VIRGLVERERRSLSSPSKNKNALRARIRRSICELDTAISPLLHIGHTKVLGVPSNMLEMVKKCSEETGPGRDNPPERGRFVTSAPAFLKVLKMGWIILFEFS